MKIPYIFPAIIIAWLLFATGFYSGEYSVMHHAIPVTNNTAAPDCDTGSFWTGNPEHPCAIPGAGGPIKASPVVDSGTSSGKFLTQEKPSTSDFKLHWVFPGIDAVNEGKTTILTPSGVTEGHNQIIIKQGECKHIEMTSDGWEQKPCEKGHETSKP